MYVENSAGLSYFWIDRKREPLKKNSTFEHDIKTNTVVLKKESKWHDLWSKWPIYDLMFYNIKMPPSSCPLGFSLLLTGALKWGTVQTSTSTYTGIMQGQT